MKKSPIKALKPVAAIFLSLLILLEGYWLLFPTFSKATAVGVEAYSVEYKELVEEYSKKEYSSAHMYFHRYGENLYRELGSEGLSVCDKSFGFGCFHGFFSLALSTEGMDILPKLEQACLEKYGEGGLGCQHGIGHGALEYFSHAKLIPALEACTKLAWRGKMFGCRDGVFMEYNFPTLIKEGSASTSLRTFDKENPYAPCPGLADTNRFSCYYSLGQWWARIFSDDFAKLGLLCDKVEGTEEEQACYLGIGNTIPAPGNLDTDRALALCKLMPTLGGEVSCRASAAWSIEAIGGTQVRDEMCESLPQSEENECMGRTDLYENSKK